MEACRICGDCDYKNVHIFQSTSEKKKPLSEKIMTVYPIIIYESDPLSKYICWKCLKNVELQYSETEKVLANQKNLIAQLEANNAGNSYMNTLRVLEKSFKVATDIIDTRIGERLSIPHMNLFGQMKCSYLPESPKKLLNDNYQNDISIPNLFIESDFIRTREEAEAGKNFFKCEYCTFKSDSSASLVQHQIGHVRLIMPKIFKKRILDENSRRGSPIILNNNEYIRCQNCGNIYEDTNQIIRHWELAECVFYCEICSEEYPSTEVLNKHILEIHGITVSSLMDARNQIMPSKVKIIEIDTVENTEKKFQTNNTSGTGNIKIIKVGLARMKVLTSSLSATKKITKPKYKPNTISTEIMPQNAQKPAQLCAEKRNSELNSDKIDTRTCSVCFIKFNNFLACNAHKRKHKISKKNTEKNQQIGDMILCSICFLRFRNVSQYNSHMKQHSLIGDYGNEQLNSQISDVTKAEAEKAPLQLEIVDGEKLTTSNQPSSLVEKINQEDLKVLENNSIGEKPKSVNNEPAPPVQRVRKKFVPYREHKSPIPLSIKDISKLKYLPANTAIKLLE